VSQPLSQPAPIKNTVFDLGAVLLHWSPEQIAAEFATDRSQQQLLLDKVFHHPDWRRLDLGQINEQQAIQCFAANTGLPQARMRALLAFIKAFLTPKPETVELLGELRDRGQRVFCLSNVCSEIYQHVASRYPFFRDFKDVIVSAEVKLAKPDPAIFTYMLQRFEIRPEQTLFIDDMPANVTAAAALGIHTIHFTDINACRSEVDRLIE